MKGIKHISVMALLIIVIASCSEYSRKTGKAYMPDMAYSRAYDFYNDNPNYANGQTAQQPVKGTMARGFAQPYTIGELDTNGAKAHKYDGSFSLDDVTEGGRLYQIHCGICHGTALDGNGPLYASGKYPAAPANFKDAKYLNMPVGTMHHAIMWGKNLMGAYASQLDAKQRWMVIAFIKSQQAENGGSPLTSSFNIGAASAPSAAVAIKDTAKNDIAPTKEVIKVEAKKEDTKKDGK